MNSFTFLLSKTHNNIVSMLLSPCCASSHFCLILEERSYLSSCPSFFSLLKTLTLTVSVRNFSSTFFSFHRPYPLAHNYAQLCSHHLPETALSSVVACLSNTVALVVLPLLDVINMLTQAARPCSTFYYTH